MQPQQSTLSRAYLEIAERHLAAAHVLLAEGLQEIAVFHSYHAFESVACSALAFRMLPIPWNHPAKIDRFLARYRAWSFVHDAGALADVLTPMRNRTLYPLPPGSSPREAFTAAQAATLLSRVEGITGTIIATLRL